MELVEQEVAVAIVERVAHAGVVAHEVACEHQQVVELEPPGATPLVDGGAHELRGGADELVDGGGGDGVDRAFDGVVGDSEGFDDRGLVGPVALLAEARCDRRTRSARTSKAAPSSGAARSSAARKPARSARCASNLSAGSRHSGRHRDDGVEGGDGFGQVERRHGSVRRQALVDEPVPIVVDDLRQRFEAGHSEAERPHHGERPLEPRIAVQTVEEAIPAFGEVDRGLDLVEDFEARRKFGLNRKLGEHALREGMERGDGGVVEVGEGFATPFGTRPTGCARVAERFPHTFPEFGRGGLGEGDGRDLRERCAAAHEGHEARDQRRRLPRAGAGFHEQRAVEVGRDGLARGLVEEGGHGVTSASTTVVRLGLGDPFLLRERRDCVERGVVAATLEPPGAVLGAQPIEGAPLAVLRPEPAVGAGIGGELAGPDRGDDGVQGVGQSLVFCVAQDEARERVVALFACEPVVRADLDVGEGPLDRVRVDRQLQPATPHHRVVGDAGEVVGHAGLVVVDEVARTVGRPVDPVDAAAESHRLGVGEVDGERWERVARVPEAELERPRESC